MSAMTPENLTRSPQLCWRFHWQEARRIDFTSEQNAFHTEEHISSYAVLLRCVS